MNKFKLVLSLEKAIYISILVFQMLLNQTEVTITDFYKFTRFFTGNYCKKANGNSYKNGENFVTSMLAKMVKQNKLLVTTNNELNHYSANKKHNLFKTIANIPSIEANIKIIVNAFRSKQDNAVLKHEEEIVKPVKNNSLKLVSHKMKTSKKRIVITENLQSRIVEVLQDNKDVKSTIIAKTLETIKPTCTSKKDFKSAINSILFQLAKLKIVTYQTIGNNVSYYRLWNIA